MRTGLAFDDVLAAGTLGRLTYARVRLSHDGATAGWLPERFFEPATAIGGALTDLGCHPVYLVQRFLGAEPETVTATYRAFTGRALEDHAVVTLGYGDGRIGVIEAGFVSADGYTVELYGTEASLTYAGDVLRVATTSTPPWLCSPRTWSSGRRWCTPPTSAGTRCTPCCPRWARCSRTSATPTSSRATV